MYLLTRRRVVIVVAVTVAALGALGLSRGTVADTPPPATLSAHQLAELGIADSKSVFGTTVATSSTGAIVADSQAMSIAAARVGRDDPPTGLLLASAAQYPGGPIRQVWVVLFLGGEAPFDGPSPGIGPKQLSLTGVIVDTQTGEVLRWFMIT